MRIKCLIIFVVLVVALVYASPVYAQKPLTKPKKPAQTVPAEKSSSTTSKSNNKSSTTKSPTQSSTSSSSSTQQTQTSSNSSQLQTNRPANGYINGHEYVDLGLSVKWATCNVGATSPSDYGDYYAWGEIKTKSDYTEKNSVTYGKHMNKIIGNVMCDVGRAIWGGTWRLPTDLEMRELIGRCKCIWTTQGGHSGYKIIAPNGNSIFLPAAGYYDRNSFLGAPRDGFYWAATPYGFGEANNLADALIFNKSDIEISWYHRFCGLSVRPVTE